MRRDEDWATFFEKYDLFRYRTEPHILEELDRFDFSGKQVLEIGIGQAADSLQIVKRGGCWSGLDLTDAAILRAKKRFELFDAPYVEAKQGSATEIPFDSQAFDIVYSHGVLHHIPEIRAVSKEIARMLKPDGQLILMLYNERSLNYLISINVLRRLLMLGLYLTKGFLPRSFKERPLISGHLSNARKYGLFKYLSHPYFLWANTDGPENPYSKVYSRKKVAEDFPEFEVQEARCHFLNERHFPGSRFLPTACRRFLGEKWGWHLWVVLRRRETPCVE